MYVGKLLIVDDDQGYANTLKTGLERVSFHVEVAHSYQSGFEALQNNFYDLILIDIQLRDILKDMSGIELARSVEAGIPVIIITGHEKIDYAIKALSPDFEFGGKVAADAFVRKEDGHDVIIAQIRHLLRAGTYRKLDSELENFNGLLKNHYEETKSQAKRNYQISYFVAACTGSLFLLSFGVSAFIDINVWLAGAGVLSSVLMSIVGFLYFDRSDKSNVRLDVTYAELAAGHRFKMLLVACEEAGTRQKKAELKEFVIKKAAENWFLNENRPFESSDPSSLVK
jgi:DNA-binding response OmpR family regulator